MRRGSFSGSYAPSEDTVDLPGFLRFGVGVSAQVTETWKARLLNTGYWASAEANNNISPGQPAARCRSCRRGVSCGPAYSAHKCPAISQRRSQRLAARNAHTAFSSARERSQIPRLRRAPRGPRRVRPRRRRCIAKRHPARCRHHPDV